MSRPTLDDLRAVVAEQAKAPKRTRVRCINCGTAWYAHLTPAEMPEPHTFGFVVGYECEACHMMPITQKAWTEAGFGPRQVGENTGGCGKIRLLKTGGQQPPAK